MQLTFLKEIIIGTSRVPEKAIGYHRAVQGKMPYIHTL